MGETIVIVLAVMFGLALLSSSVSDTFASRERRLSERDGFYFFEGQRRPETPGCVLFVLGLVCGIVVLLLLLLYIAYRSNY